VAQAHPVQGFLGLAGALAGTADEDDVVVLQHSAQVVE
jgi:hypothetical protein